MFLEPFNFTNPIKDISNLIKKTPTRDVVELIQLRKKYGNLVIFNIQEQEI